MLWEHKNNVLVEKKGLGLMEAKKVGEASINNNGGENAFSSINVPFSFLSSFHLVYSTNAVGCIGLNTKSE